MHNLPALMDSLSIAYERVGSSRVEEFHCIAPLDECSEDDLAFVNRSNAATMSILAALPARLALIERTWGSQVRTELDRMDKSFYLVDNPRLTAAALLSQIGSEVDFVEPGIHPTAIVNPETCVPYSTRIGAFCQIGKCQIGENVWIGSHTIIKDGVVIGDNVSVREFCLIGGAGFGFERDASDRLIRIPHIGRVVIEDEVDIFPYVNIDRGTLGETRICRGVKIDHYAHIGHNSTIGPDSVITAGVVLCGGSSVGASSWVGVGGIIKEKIAVGSKVTIGLGSVVVKPVADGLTVAGVPAAPLQEKGQTLR